MFSTRLCASLTLVALLLIASPSTKVVADEEHFLDYSEDNFKTALMSGNFTATVQYDWPRIIWQHTRAMLAPDFEVGYHTLYLFNDSDGDGLFARSEALYAGYMDMNHVDWNVSALSFSHDDISGEYAEFWMKTNVSLYQGLDNQTVWLDDWANVTFWYMICENNVTYVNSQGSYVVLGKIEMRMNLTLEIKKRVNCTGVALERLLKGGGSTPMFLLRQDTGLPDPSLVEISSRIDEREFGDNFTHRFLETKLATQDVYYAKEDGTIQASYRFSSIPLDMSNVSMTAIPLNSSYYSMGTGLYMHTAFSITNETELLTNEFSVGIVESGFGGSVVDWLEENLPAFVAFVSIIIAVVILSACIAVKRKRRRTADAEKGSNQVEKPPPKSD